MPKCPKCYKENPAGQLYCGHCGIRIAVNEGEEPYYSWTLMGTTTTHTRKAYWMNYAMLIGLCVLSAVMWVAFYVSTHALPFLAVTIVFLLLALFGFAVASTRARNIDREKRKGV